MMRGRDPSKSVTARQAQLRDPFRVIREWTTLVTVKDYGTVENRLFAWRLDAAPRQDQIPF
ncbi:MAG: hypothetical protein JWR21_57 [Herminiimonas sp.]|nr:hypothetical protein [Herminiimonas sp.]